MIKSRSQILQEITQLSPKPEHVKLLAVSKKQSPDKIQWLYQQGQMSFGENYVQEAIEKITQLPLAGIDWHFIGHLQTNKVKDVVGKFSLIHSVDSLKLAQHISKKAKELNIVQSILIEINIAAEESKSGFILQDLKNHWAEITALENIRIMGLMCLPPADVSESITTTYFQNMIELSSELKNKTSTEKHPLTELSMGTSGDYQLALKNNATIIRLGTILFGERN